MVQIPPNKFFSILISYIAYPIILPKTYKDNSKKNKLIKILFKIITPKISFL